MSNQSVGSRFERFPAVAAPQVPAERKNALIGCFGGCKPHAEHQNLVRQRQLLWPKSSSVQRSETHASVTWWLLPATKESLVRIPVMMTGQSSAMNTRSRYPQAPAANSHEAPQVGSRNNRSTLESADGVAGTLQ